MIFTQVRHATCIIEFGGMTFLVDPILYEKETLDPIKGGIDKWNPLIDMIVKYEALKSIDAILLTHIHRDHYDPSIIDFFGKDIPIICSDEYNVLLSKSGFSNLHLLIDSIMMNDIEIILTKGKHGTGAVGELMGNSYGFILKAKEKTLYITGDTIWCNDVENVIDNYAPTYIVVFAGSAMIDNLHITMNKDDMKKLVNKSPNSKIIAIHMDAWNHCVLTRQDLEETFPDNENLFIPQDGEVLTLK